jgi:four helix bundle protein
MNYSNLHAWQESFQLLKEVYALTNFFPSSEKFGLVSQMKRAALSIPSNIAEGSRRNSRKDYRHFCNIAFGSASELEVQMRFAQEMHFAPENEFIQPAQRLQTTLRLLHGLCRSLTCDPTTHNP